MQSRVYLGSNVHAKLTLRVFCVLSVAGMLSSVKRCLWTRGTVHQGVNQGSSSFGTNGVWQGEGPLRTERNVPFMSESPRGRRLRNNCPKERKEGEEICPGGENSHSQTSLYIFPDDWQKVKYPTIERKYPPAPMGGWAGWLIVLVQTTPFIACIKRCTMPVNGIDSWFQTLRIPPVLTAASRGCHDSAFIHVCFCHCRSPV